jgi:phosphatidylserine decarboxylase
MRIPIAREGLPFVVVPAGVAVLASFWTAWIAAPAALFTLFAVNFFRDPERTTPEGEGLLVAPADGKILVAGPGRISIFMNVFDVHVCRAPAAGRVSAVEHSRGRFLSAFKDAASEQNERTHLTLDSGAEPIRFTLVAGLVARRIVCWVGAGQALRAGERVGLILFGSRVDVDLPSGATPAVRIGDRVRAGETVIARRPPSGAGEGA